MLPGRGVGQAAPADGCTPVAVFVVQLPFTLSQGSRFSGISLISGKSEVPFQGNSHSFSENDM